MQLLKQPDDLYHWMHARKKYCYFIQYLGPTIPASIALLSLYSNNGNWFWATVLIFYFGSAIMDWLIGKDTSNALTDDEQTLQQDTYYNRFLVVLMPLYLLAFTLTCIAVTRIDISWHQYLAALIGTGAMFAGVFCISHELGHRREPLLRFWARFGVALYGYGHFHIEHNRGHHVQVATPEDAASARMGENLYQFMAREVPNTWRRAIKLERERLARLGKSFYSSDNEIFQSYAMTLAIYAALTILCGLALLPFLILSGFFGYLQLTMANYLEHYGLLRQKLANGRYEKCQPHHSWNSNHFFTNMLTVQLQRHSDHHANASREFQILRDYTDVPELPAGYPLMQFISAIPPLWRHVMDKRLLEFVDYDMHKVNVDPRKREQLYARYHRPSAA